MPMSDLPMVSVIIPTHNRQEKIISCVESIFNQSYGDKEIIIIDNASCDQTQFMLKEKFPAIIYCHNQHNRGAAFARNQGIARSRGKYVWFLDSDSLAENKYCLSAMVEILEHNADIGSIGGELCQTASGGELFLVKYLTKGGYSIARYIKSEEAILKDCDYCATCNSFMRRDDIIRLGGFDPTYFYLAEDADIGYRIKGMGKRNVCDQRTAVFHDVVLDTRRSLFLRLRNQIRFIIKNFSLLSIIMLPFSAVCFIFSSQGIRRLKIKDPSVFKYMPSKEMKREVIALFIVKLVICSIGALLWNIIFLPQTLRARLTKRNYIADAEKFSCS